MKIAEGKYYRGGETNVIVKALGDTGRGVCFKGVVVVKNASISDVGHISTGWNSGNFTEIDYTEDTEEGVSNEFFPIY